MLVGRDCVECRAFGTGEKKQNCSAECGYFALELVDDRKSLPDSERRVLCKQRAENDCWFYYIYEVVNGTQEMVYVAKKQGERHTSRTEDAFLQGALSVQCDRL